MSGSLNLLLSHLDSLKNPPKSKDLSWFFKTSPGQYGEGDKFLGIVVPLQRQAVKLYWDTVDLSDIQKLLNSEFHEHRLVGLLILIKQFPKDKENIFNFYLKNTSRINNWDLVDLSAPNIIGQYLLDKPRDILYKLAKSPLLWERRISIISTATFIRNNQFTDTLEISKILLSDKEDLIHKAVGWMLREVGKRDQKILTDFLDQYTLSLPRTTLRYAIEKFPPALRLHYLHKS